MPLTKRELLAAAQHLVNSPHYASRRVSLTTAQLQAIITNKLVQSGMSGPCLDAARWVWLTTVDGDPTLHIILPGGSEA